MIQRERWCRSLGLLVLLLLAAAWARAEIKLPALISEGMVLQRGVPVRIWGWADEGEQVLVKIQNQSETTIASQGKWSVTLAPLKAGGPFELTIAGKNTPRPFVFKDVLVGEVWICSGQSNMQWSLAGSFEAEKHLAAAGNPKLRLFTVPNVKSDTPLDDVVGKWSACTPESAKGFSAIAYFFGRDLQKALGVPVGLIHTSWGGSPAEVWVKEPVLRANPEFASIFENWRKAYAGYEKAKAAFDAKPKESRKQGERPPSPPWKPCELYNAMIAPLLPYAIKGAIWYQGESNAGRPGEYRKLFPTMIQNWRQDWRLGDLTFLEVQLAPFMAIKDQPAESGWAELREAQLLATQILPNVGMAVITDVGDPKDIHPRKKEPVGARLALAARGIAYGERIEYSGPVYRSCEIRRDRIILHFYHVGRGLVAKDGPLKGFAVAGENRAFVWADAVIDGNTVVVSSKEVPRPAFVRYGWADCPVVNLWNKNGLPASPFRTDRPESDMSY